MVWPAGALHHGPRGVRVAARSLGRLLVPGAVGAAVGREPAAGGQGWSRDSPSLLEVGRQGREVLGHVAVDVDDRVVEAAVDLG